MNSKSTSNGMEELSTREENPCLLKLQNNNKQLRNELFQRDKLMKELEKDKQQKELRLESIESLIKNKLDTVEAEKHLKVLDCRTEAEWNDKLNQAREKKFVSLLEYQKKMTEFRNQIFSPDNLDDVKMNEEIQEFMKKHEDICKDSHSVQLRINEKQVTLNSETEVNNIIDGIQMLIEELVSEIVVDQKEYSQLETKFLDFDEQIKKSLKSK